MNRERTVKGTGFTGNQEGNYLQRGKQKMKGAVFTEREMKGTVLTGKGEK